MRIPEQLIPEHNRTACAHMAEWIRREDDFLLITHVSPDGDAIGCSLALYGILKDLGKRVVACCEQAVPKTYRFLPFAEEMQLSGNVQAVGQNVIALDCADAARMGSAQTLFAQGKATGVIDHHVTREAFAAHCIHDAGAAATAELVLQLWLTLQPDSTKNPWHTEIATCLFVALSTDTGHFAYRNTTAYTFEAAALLRGLGVDIDALSSALYRTVSIGKTRLRGHVINAIRLFENGRIGFSTITQADLAACGAASEDAEGMIDSVRDVESVQIAVLVREAKNGDCKVSFRTKGGISACEIAAGFGGGGHFAAAACTIQDMIENTVARVLSVAREALQK